MSWTQLLERVFDVDHCPRRRGRLEIIAPIEQRALMRNILTYPGLSRTKG